MSLIDERLLTLSEAAAMIPGAKPGQSINRSTIFRWTTAGRHGVRLETIRLGRIMTSIEALQRFGDAVEQRHSGAAKRPAPTRTPSRARTAAERAGAELDRIL